MKVLIAGSGFGGIKTALELSEHDGFDVALISPHMNFEYHAALYRSATGWSPREVIMPLRDIFGEKPVRLIQDSVSGIDVENHTVTGETGKTYTYDRLVLAIGGVINYYGIEGMRENSYSMDSIASTIRLRQHLREQVEGPEKTLKFVVVGGGATGVELASELKFFVNELARRHDCPAKETNVILVEGSSRLLPALSPKLSKVAEWRLKELGVDIRLKTMVEGRTVDDISLGGEVVKTHSVIWTAGFANNPFFRQHEGIFTLARNGRVEVDEYLRANQDVYVIGDSANTQYSGMAQTALFDAGFVAENLIREQRGKKPKLYVPKRPIYVIPVGQEYAVLQWGRLVLWGKPAWYIRRLADFRLFSEFEPLAKAIKTWRAGRKRAKWFEVE